MKYIGLILMVVNSIVGCRHAVPQSVTTGLEYDFGYDSLEANSQIRIPCCYAYSNKENGEDSNGEHQSENRPQQVVDSIEYKGFYLLIDNSKTYTNTGYDLGLFEHKLYLINMSDSLVELEASDSRLYIQAEALNQNKKWKPITYFPQSFCGNSYHTVKLDTNEYWEFDVPVFKGSFKTKLRYTLLLGDEKKISSNEIDVHINLEQFDREKKEGNNNIMNPYSD